MPGVVTRNTQAIKPRNLIPAGTKTMLHAAREFVAGFCRTLECPLCHVRARSFLPFGLDLPILKKVGVVGGGYRENAQCPGCGSIDRERLLFLYLVHQTDLFDRPIRLLHVAPEARVSEALHAHSNIDYLTADISGAQVMQAIDITNIPYAVDSFDAIICNHVLEHILDDVKAMSELFRVLRPGGWSILQVPFGASLPTTIEDASITSCAGREAAFGQADHVRIYGQDYALRLARAGFDVEVFRWTSRRSAFGGWLNRFGLNLNECVFVARKRC